MRRTAKVSTHYGRARRRTVALGIAVALALTACGSNGDTTANDTETETVGSPDIGDETSPDATAEPTTAGDATAPSEPIALDIGLPALVGGYSDVYIAHDQGFFEDELLEIDSDWTTCGGSAGCAQQLQAGAFDIVSHAPDVGVQAWQQGGDPVFVAANIERQVYFAAGNPEEAESWEDLQGREFGVAGLQGTEPYMISRLAEENGLTPGEDFTLLALGGTPDKLAALEAGAVPAASIYPPQIYQLEDELGYVILGKTSDLEENFPIAWVVSREWIESSDENREALIRFLRAIHRAHEWMADPENREEVVSIISETVDTDPQYVQQLYDLYWAEEGLYSPDGSFSPDVMETIQDMLESEGELEERQPADTWVDLSYLEEAMRTADELYGN